MAVLPVLVLGTHNQKKRLELAEQFQPVGLELRTLDDFPGAIQVLIGALIIAGLVGIATRSGSVFLLLLVVLLLMSLADGSIRPTPRRR